VIRVDPENERFGRGTVDAAIEIRALTCPNRTAI